MNAVGPADCAGTVRVQPLYIYPHRGMPPIMSELKHHAMATFVILFGFGVLLV